MPEVPVFDIDANQASRHIPPAFDAAAAGIPGRAISQVGSDLVDFSQRYLQAKRQSDAADAINAAAMKLNDAQFRWSKVPDNQQALTGFNTEAAKIKSDALAGVQDPLIAGVVTRAIDQDMMIRSQDTRNAAFQLESSARRGALDQRLENYSELAASATDPTLRQHYTDMALGDIRGSVAGGWLHPEDGAREEMRFTSLGQEVQIRRAFNQALQTQSADTANRLVQAIDNPENFPGLLPERREMLAARAENLTYRLTMRQASLLQHQDALADRQLHRAQADNEANILMQTYKGAPPDDATLEGLVFSHQISAPGLEAIHAARDRVAAGKDDPEIASDLWGQVGTRDIHDDALAAYRAGALSTRTLTDMTKANASRRATQASAQEHEAFGALKTSLGAQPIEQGVVLNRGPGEATHIAAWAEAQGEFYRRVDAGEKPWDVSRDLTAKYQPLTAHLPAPALGPVRSLADVDRVAVATYQAAQQGKLAPGAYQDQVRLLTVYRGYLRLMSQTISDSLAVRPQPRAIPSP